MSAFIGIVFAVVGGSLVLAALRELAKVRQLKAGTPLRCADLPQAAGQVCEVTGTAQPGAGGIVAGPASGAQGVWFLYRITRHWWERDHTDSSSTGRRHRREVVHETRSQYPFLVDDGSGRVVVPHDGHDLGTPAELRTFAQKAGPPGEAPSAMRSFDLERQWWEYEEWVLPRGTPLFVSGEVGRHAHLPSLGKPSRGRGQLLISTKDEGALLRPARRNAVIFGVVGTLFAAGGAAALVLSL